MTTVLQWNLDGSGLRQRFRVGPANAWICGDSLSSPQVVKERFFPAFLRAFKWPLRGVYIPASRLGGLNTDGMVSLHLQTGDANVSFDGAVNPDAAGGSGLVSFPGTVLLPMNRYETTYNGEKDPSDTMQEQTIIGPHPKPGGTYEWGAGDWLAGKSVSAGVGYVAHANSLTDVEFRTDFQSATIARSIPIKGTFDSSNPTVAVRETSFAFGTDVGADSLFPADWNRAGIRLETGVENETGKSWVQLYAHIWADEMVDGVQFGAMASSGLTTEDWIARTNPAVLASFIETTKADTFIFMFGANDSAAKTKAQYKADIQAAIDMIVTASATARGNDATIRVPKFLLVAVYEVQGRAVLAEYADALLEISQSETYKDKAAFINLHKLAGAFNIIDVTLLSDGTHQTEVGAITLSQMIWNQIDTNPPDNLLDVEDGVESGLTVRESLRVMTSALMGKVNGAGTPSVKFRDLGDTKDRITVTVDGNGNRSSVVLDKT